LARQSIAIQAARLSRRARSLANVRRHHRRDQLGRAANALGAMAVGAVAFGALAIGAVAIGRLVIGRARVRRLEIDELVVHRMTLPDQGSDERPNP
jgi:cytochrome b